MNSIVIENGDFEDDEEDLSPEEKAQYDEEMTVQAQVQQVASLLGADEALELRIHRIPKMGGQKRPYLFPMSMDDIGALEERLMTEYGTGEYEVRLWDGKQIRRRLRVEIEAPKKEVVEQKSQSTGIEALIVSMNDNFQRSMRDSERRTNDMQVKMMEMQMAMQSNMMELFKNNNNADQLGVRDVIEIADKMAGGKSNPMKEIKDLLAVTKDVKEFTQGEEPSTEIGALSKAVGDLVSLAQSSQNGQTTSNAQTAAPVQNPAPNGNAQMREMLKFKKLAEQMINKAQKGSDPDLCADWILEEIDESVWPHIFEIISHDNRLAIVAQYVPAVKDHGEWFNLLFDSLKAALTPAAEPDDNSEHEGQTVDNTERPGGHESDADDHAPSDLEGNREVES